MHVLIHGSGGAALGLGHVVRAYALAEEACARGHQVTFTGGYAGSFVEELLARLPVDARPTPDDPAPLIRQLRPDVVHLDSYEQIDIGSGQTLLSNIEDGSFGRRPADLAVDPNLGADAEPRPAVPALLLLRGSRFAPLRASVTSLRGRARVRDVAERVLVVMGGTDPSALSPRAVRALAATGLPLEITVVAPEGRHADCRAAAAGSSVVELELVSGVADLPTRMVEQDLVVSAAGTSVWELCCLGLPMALVSAVDNQEAGYDRVVAAGAALGLGKRLANVDEATHPLARALLDPAERRLLAARASAIVDGRGAWRIVGAWEQLLAVQPDAHSGPHVDTRPATLADAELLLAWRNDPGTRTASRGTDEVRPEAHMHWLEQTLARDDRLLLVGTDEDGAVGTVRWDRQDVDGWEVSITVAPERRGTGMAHPLLAAGERALQAFVGRPALSLAAVRASNEASRRLFMRSGYLLEAPVRDGFELFAKQLPAPG